MAEARTTAKVSWLCCFESRLLSILDQIQSIEINDMEISGGNSSLTFGNFVPSHGSMLQHHQPPQTQQQEWAYTQSYPPPNTQMDPQPPHPGFNISVTPPPTQYPSSYHQQPHYIPYSPIYNSPDSPSSSSFYGSVSMNGQTQPDGRTTPESTPTEDTPYKIDFSHMVDDKLLGEADEGRTNGHSHEPPIPPPTFLSANDK